MANVANVKLDSSYSLVYFLPVSRIPIDIPMLDMSPVRTSACLQKGIPNIPTDVTSIEKPARQDNEKKNPFT